MDQKLRFRYSLIIIALLFFGFQAQAQLRLNASQNTQQQTARSAPMQSTQLSQANSNSETPAQGATDEANQSPFDAVAGKKEDFSKRDAFSKHYANEDGSFTALIGAGPIHYEKNGQFYDIDHEITRQSDSRFSYANTTNIFESHFGNTSHTGVKSVTAEGEVTEFQNTQMYWEVNGQAVNTIHGADVAVSVEDDKAYYHNLFGSISAEFVMLTGKRELNYIIPNRVALANAPQHAEFLVFSEDVVLPEGWTSTETENGILIKDRSGKEIYLYENPFSTDASEELALSREQNTLFETSVTGNILTVKTKVKTSWLLDNNRQFPVKVDPTVNVYPNNANRWSVSVYDDGDEDVPVGYFGAVSGFELRYHVKFNTTSIPAGSTVNSATGYIYIYGHGGDYTYYSPAEAYIFKNSNDPTTTNGTTLFNSATNILSTRSPDLGWGWQYESATFTNEGITYIQNNYQSNAVSLAVVPDGNYEWTDYFGARTHNDTQKPYLQIDYSVSTPFECDTLSNLNVELGDPFNGPNHYIDISWDGITGATGYDIQYSENNQNWFNASPASVTTTSASLNMGDNPNKQYWFRVRAKNASQTCAWTYPQPIYTACDMPELPGLSNASGTSLNLDILAETPVANPAHTEYAIYCETTGLYVQANGSLGTAEVWQTKANWGTVNVNGLIANTEYCFYAKARNQDGHIVGGSSSLLTETFDSNILDHGVTGQDNKWFAPNSNPPIVWNASYGCPSGGGGIGYSTTTANWSNFVRTPVLDLTGLDEVTMTFDVTNSYSNNRPNAKIYFNMWVGSYVNATSVNGMPTHELMFDQLRSCEKVTVKYDLSGVTNKSAVFLYFNAQSGSGSDAFSFQIDNVNILEAGETACITTANPLTPVFHNYGGEEQLAFNNSRIDTNNPVFRLSHSENVASNYEVEINTSSDFSGTGFTQDFSVNNPANTEVNVNFTNGFTPASGNTYYVRARAKEATGSWSNWTSEVYSFTFQSPHEVPDWFQTTTPQFNSDELDGVISENGDVRAVVSGGGGGNPILNPSFETSSNWTAYKTGGSVLNVVISDGNNWSSNGNRAARMYMYGGYAMSSDIAVISQVVDLTNVEQIIFDAQSHYGQNMFSSLSNGGTLRLIIGGTSSDSSGTVVATINHCVNGSNSCSNQTLDVTANIPVANQGPNQLVKFVWTGFSTGDLGGALVHFMVDNVRASAPVSASGTITSTPIHFASVQGAEGYDEFIWNQTLGGGSLKFDIEGSSDGQNFTNISGYANLEDTSGDGTKSIDISEIDPGQYPHLRIVGHLDGENVRLHDWTISFNTEPPAPQYDFIYWDDTIQWTPNYPGDTGNPSTEIHTILVMEGTAEFDTDIVAKDLTVNEGANLNVKNILKIHGDVINNGNITFKSWQEEVNGVNKLFAGQFDEFDTDNGSVFGNSFTVERFIPARRSFRFLSSAVTGGTIHSNWQEGVNNTGIGEEFNLDPNEGFGTHITGSQSGANGFDATNTGNPSMFTIITNGSQQDWVAVANTDETALEAGVAYRLMVRGDRSIDLTDNDPEPTNTTLRSTGILTVGDAYFEFGNLEGDQYVLIGNPYQAIVDIADLLRVDNSNINPNEYYIWDPQLAGTNGRGAFATVDMRNGGINYDGSQANGYLQPGQAIMLRATGEGPVSATFKEVFKRVEEDMTYTFLVPPTHIAMQLYYRDAFENGETATDGLGITFDPDGNNGIDRLDAPKMGNLDENLAAVNDGQLFAIERRALPQNEEVIPLFINNYRQTEYVFRAQFISAPEGTTAYLYDNYTGDYTEVSEHEATVYPFDLVANDPASMESDRFEIRFAVRPLGIDDFLISEIQLYPNPTLDNSFNLSAKGFEGQNLDIEIVNMIGQLVHSEQVTVSSDGHARINLAENFATGVYSVKITTEGNGSVSKKLIKN